MPHNMHAAMINTDRSPNRKPRDTADGTMRFGLFWPGTRTKLPSAEISALNPDNLDLGNHLSLIAACEEVGLDFVLLGDGYAPSSEEGTKIGFQDPGIHALILTLPLILASRHIGILTTLHSTFFHPAHVARFAANLDWMSGGRWGWNIVNGYRDYEASLFGFESLPDRSSLYDAASEAIQVMESLWDARQRTEFAGAHYHSHGLLKGPYPNDRPVYVCAAASSAGRRFTTRHCDFLFASPSDFAEIKPVREKLEQHAAELGKATPPRVLVVADLLIRDRAGEANKLFEEMMATIPKSDAGQKWSGQIGRLRGQPVNPFEFPALVGTPNEVADQLIAAYRDHDVNGIMFRPLIASAEEMLRLAPVFERLEAEGIRIAPAERNYSW